MLGFGSLSALPISATEQAATPDGAIAYLNANTSTQSYAVEDVLAGELSYLNANTSVSAFSVADGDSVQCSNVNASTQTYSVLSGVALSYLNANTSTQSYTARSTDVVRDTTDPWLHPTVYKPIEEPKPKKRKKAKPAPAPKAIDPAELAKLQDSLKPALDTTAAEVVRLERERLEEQARLFAIDEEEAELLLVLAAMNYRRSWFKRPTL